MTPEQKTSLREEILGLLDDLDNATFVPHYVADFIDEMFKKLEAGEFSTDKENNLIKQYHEKWVK